MSGTAPAAAAGSWDPRIAIAAAAAVVAAVLTAIWLGLENPWWSALSAWRVADARPANTLWRAVQRVVGTLAGGGGAYALAGLVAGHPAAQAVVLFGVAALVTWMRFTVGTWTYAWVLGGVTAMLVLVQSLSDPGDLHTFLVYRVAEIVCGVVVASLVTVLLAGGQALGPPPAAAAAPGPEARAEIRRVALLAGLAIVLVVLLWDVFDLPQVVQIAVSVLLLMDRDMIALRHKGWLRLWGCVCGGAYGLMVMALGLEAVTLWVAAVMGGLVLFSRSALWGVGGENYFGLQAGFALLICLVSGSGPPADLAPVADRFVGILLGVGLMVALSFLLAPRDARAEGVTGASSGGAGPPGRPRSDVGVPAPAGQSLGAGPAMSQTPPNTCG